MAVIDEDQQDGDSDDIARPESWDAERLVTQAYLRTLSRAPSTQELEIATDHMRNTEDPIEGLRSVLWALVNTKEFIVNH